MKKNFDSWVLIHPTLKKLIMELKIAILVILLSVTNVFGTHTYSQSAKVTLDMRNTTLEQVMDEIERQSEFYFIFNQKQIDVGRVVNIKTENRLIDEILPDIFSGTNVNYAVLDRKILLTTDPLDDKLSVFRSGTTDQQKRVTGKVTDRSGTPLAGVSVVVTGTAIGMITDADGGFSLSIPENARTLSFTFVGMNPHEVQIGEQSVFNITMEQANIGLDEVIVVGYGTVRKRDLTGSVSSVKGEEISEIPMTRIEQQLQTQVPGLNISTSNNAPGGTIQMRIRGSNSIQGDNNPLVVIDGMIGGELKYINSNDIESIEVLKDASATAIYGSRGANGVIIVTTKKGRSEQVNINFDAYYGIQSVAKKIDVMNTEEWASVVSQFYTPDWDSTINTDWQDEIFQIAPVQNYHLSLSGGGKNNSYMFSTSLLNQDGVIINSDYKILTARFNFEQNIGKNITVGNNLSFSKSWTNQIYMNEGYGTSGNPVTIAALLVPPVVPVYYEDGSYGLNTYANTSDNPVAIINERTDLKKKNYLIGNFYTDVKFLKNFTYRVNVGYIVSNQVNQKYDSKLLISSGKIGIAQNRTNSVEEYLIENTLNYKKLIGDNHSLEVLAGATMQNQNAENTVIRGRGFTSDELGFYGLANASQFYGISTGETRKGIVSFLGRVNYSFKDKYYLTVSGRQDGSSVFAKNNKWAFFPSFSTSWRITNEPFMAGIKNIADVKLRAGYGKTGSQAINPYQSLETYSGGITYNLNETEILTNGTLPGKLANNSLRWETTSSYDIGIDISLFKGELQLIADYYNKKTNDLLYDKEVPKYSGYADQVANIGSMRNSGFETELIFTHNFEELYWLGSFNLFLNKNEVVDLGGDEMIPVSSGGEFAAISQSGVLTPGQPLGIFYGYVFDGIYQNEEEVNAIDDPSAAPGRVKFRDVNGDNKIDINDKTFIGDPNPDFIWGYRNELSYRGWNLVFNLRGVHGNEIFWTAKYILSRVSTRNNGLIEKLNYWRGDGTSNTMQAINEEPGLTSSRYVEDGSYIRLQNISLGYDLPKKLIQGLSIDAINIYVSAQNLITLTNYPGYDPEVNSRGGNDDLSNTTIRLGYDQGAYPGTKSYTFGVNIKF